MGSKEGTMTKMMTVGEQIASQVDAFSARTRTDRVPTDLTVTVRGAVTPFPGHGQHRHFPAVEAIEAEAREHGYYVASTRESDGNLVVALRRL